MYEKSNHSQPFKLLNKNEKNYLKVNGITLIALVVTIVVLLILAGVTITMVLGEDGIIAQAKLAAERVKEEEAKAQGDLANLVEEMNNILTSELPTKPTTTPTPTQKPEGTPTTLVEAKKQETPFEQTTEVTDGNKSMTIPAGFKILEGDSIDTGIVVQDRAENEFVWVPVEDINNMVMCKTHPTATISYENGEFSCVGKEHKPDQTQLVGKLYTFTGNTSAPRTTYDTNSGYREPAVVTGDSSGNGTKYDGADENLSKVIEEEEKTRAKFLEQLQNEFYEMATSVAKYGGFYIGRYETSDLNTNEPKVISGVSSTVSIDWYTMYKNSKEIAKGALKPEEKAEKSSSVTSSMIWGCQWDAVMNWMKDIENTTVSEEAKKYYITDSTGMGWYNTTKNKTGTPISEKNENEVNKIWDMAGNVWEWTLEANGADGRVCRGGRNDNSGSEKPASVRSDRPPTSGSGNNGVGSRVVLFFK